MTPTQLPSGAWRLRVYLGKDENGKSIYQSVTSPDKYECIRLASELAQRHHETILDQSTMTLEEAITKYINMKSNVLSPSTIRGYKNIKKNHLQPEMLMQLRNITDNVAQVAINREAKTSGPKTVANVKGLLSAVIKQFCGRQIRVTLPQSDDFEGNILDKDQCAKLIKAVDGESIEVPVLLAMFLGLRRSEILALEHGDWDSEKQLLHVTKAKVPNENHVFVVKTTKTRKSKRTLPVPAYLALKLDECVALNIPFCNVHANTLSKRLTLICKEEGLPHMRLHDLRHQNASIMLELGTPDKYAMERGGWSSIQTLKRIYQHTTDAKREAVNAEIERYFAELLKEEKSESGEV